MAAGAVTLAVLSRTAADPDLWGHLAFGRLVLTQGLAAPDPFSYTAAGRPWINHEWFSDVLIYAAFQVAGPIGLVTLKVLVLGGMLAAVLRAVREAKGGVLAAAAVSILLVGGGLPSFETIRPHMFTFLLFALFLLAIVRADRGRRGLLWFTPVLTVLWSNLHGGVAAGLAVLLLWGALRLAQAGAGRLGLVLPAALRHASPDDRTAMTIAIVLVLQLPAALVTPYGTRLWSFVGETVTGGLPELSEWQPPMRAEFTSALRLSALAMLGALALLPRGAPRDPVYVLIIALLSGAGLSARRHVTLALIGAAVLGAPHAAHALRRRNVSRSGAHRGMGVAVVVLAGAVLVAGLQRARCVRIDESAVPRAAVIYLKAASVSGNMAVFFDWGQYAIWHLGPRLRVSVDARTTTLYPPTVLRDHLAFLHGSPGWRATLDGADVALLSPRFAVYERLATDADWRLAFTDDVSGLFVRRGTPADAALARTAPPTLPLEKGRCLEWPG